MKNLSLFTLLFISVANVLSSCQKETVIEKEIVRDTLVVIDTLDLDRPIGLSASKGLYGSKIALSWEAMPLAKKYEVWKFDNVLQKYSLFKEVQTNSAEDLTLDKSLTKIFYKVRTIDQTNTKSRFSDADFGYTSAFNYYKAFSFGSEGSGPAHFNFTMHVEVDKNGNIYVSDEGASRVLKFSASGTFIEQFYSGSGARAIAFFDNGNYLATRTQSSSYVQIFNPNKQLVREWGTYGSGDSNFGNIECITIDDEQNIWIVDGINHRVKKYDQNGNLLLKFGKQGKGHGDFDAPFGIAYFKNKIYVSDTRNNRVEVFDKSGKFLKIYGSEGYIHGIRAFGDNLFLADANGFIIKSDENGDVQEKIGTGLFQNLVDVTIAPNGDVIACDVYARKIIVFKKG